MSKNPIDVSYTDVNKKYYTIDEVAEILKIEQSKIIFYFEKLNDFLNIKSVGMYQLFDDTDIQNLKYINDLEKTKNMSMKEIKTYLLKNKQEVIIKKEFNNTLDASVLNIFTKFANSLIEQNSKIDSMCKINSQLVESVKYLSQHQEIIESELQEQKELNNNISNKLDIVNKELAITKEMNLKLDQQSKQIEDNFNYMNDKIIERDVQIVNDLALRLEKHKQTQEEQSHESFFSKLFHKNK